MEKEDSVVITEVPQTMGNTMSQIRALANTARIQLTAKRDQILAELNDVQRELDWLDGVAANRPKRAYTCSKEKAQEMAQFAEAVKVALASQKGQPVHTQVLYEALKDQGMAQSGYHAFYLRVSGLAQRTQWMKKAGRATWAYVEEAPVVNPQEE